MVKRLRIGLIVCLLVGLFGGTGSAQATQFLFDFGLGPVAEGYIGVRCDEVYSPEKGYGFVTAVQGRDRGDQPDAVKRDFCNEHPSLQFQVDLPNGMYLVEIVMGDQIATQVETTIVMEGETVAEGARAGRGSFYEETFRVIVTDGQLNVELSANDNTVRINGLKVERVG